MYFILWTTFICIGGNIQSTPHRAPNMYSSKFYTSIEQVYEAKNKWNKIYGSKSRRCGAFMVQHEEVTNKLILKDLLGIGF